MTTPSVSWDETSPAGSTSASAGDDRIRELKTQIREVIDVDHDFPSSGQASDVGQHKQVTLQEQADLGTGAVNATIAGSQTVGGKGEFVYTDEDDNDVQLTNQGTPININAVTAKTAPVLADAMLINDSEASDVSKQLTLSNLLKLVYPVGSIYSNASDGTNPATLFGFGTWSLIGAGRIPICIDSGDADFDTLGETQGSKTADLSHTHDVNDSGYTRSEVAGQVGITGVAVGGKEVNNYGAAETIDTASAGSATQSIVPPVVVCSIWKRTA